MSFGASELITQAKWWEGESSALSWQVPSPWNEWFLLITFLVILWVLLVPGPRSSSLWLALPCPIRADGPGQACMTQYCKALVCMLNEAPRAYWALVAASTYINPEVLNFSFEGLASFLKNAYINFYHCLKKKTEMNNMCCTVNTQRLTISIIYTDFFQTFNNHYIFFH